MHALIPPGHYHQESIFQREQSQFFATHWQFVGFKHELLQHNDFVCREIGGESVVVQNLRGSIRAFQNVCSHRFSRIQTECRGNRPLQCPYHGWTYDSDGRPSGIPHRPRFDDVDAACLQRLRLRQWEVDTCGNLVFVRGSQDDDTGTLRDFLGASYDTVEQFSNSLGPQFDRNEMIVDANWKILVENTLESYHVDFVHADSFKSLGADGGEFTFHAPHSGWRVPLDETVAKRLRKVMPMFRSRPLDFEGYHHQLVFPNLTLATTNGTSFSIQLFDPIAPNETAFTSWVFQTRLDNELTDSKQRLVDAMNLSVKAFNRQVFEEDKVVCEHVQKGVTETTQQGMLSDEELRVYEFQLEYMLRFESQRIHDTGDSKSASEPSRTRNSLQGQVTSE